MPAPSTTSLQPDVPLLQRRLRTLFWTFATFSWIAVLAHAVVGMAAPEVAIPFARMFFLSSVCVSTGAAVLLRRPRSVTTVNALDLGVTLVVSGWVAAMMLYPFARNDELYLALAANGFFAIARSFFLPASPRRTAALATLGAVPPLVATLYIAANDAGRLTLPRAPFVVNVAFALLVPVVLAWVGATVIAGLFAEVRAARRLGQYTLDEKIGEGGMGVVYRAHHAMLRRPTAVKLLPAEKSSEAAVAGFEREVQLTAQLTGPHVVAIFDYGRSDDGTFYYAMEYLDGLDLERLVVGWGPQPPARVAGILAQVCDALAEAHARGLVHRDIKPANILLCERGTRCDVAKVVDFGLVRHVAAEDGVVAGTPGFLAPEALAGPSELSVSVDLYAVGAVAYFLLAGRLPFEGDTAAKLIEAQLRERAPTLSSRGISIDADLEALVLRCLEREPALRPASAAELGAQLSSLVGKLSPWGEPDARQWWSSFRRQRAERQESDVADTAPVASTLLIAHR